MADWRGPRFSKPTRGGSAAPGRFDSCALPLDSSNPQPRRVVIGTAGHVDHGKTALVRALTGIDTDRLPDEKRRGITIELGFARWLLEPGCEASVVDVPGHRKLVRTMIAGSIGMQLVLMVVACDEGPMPQTREHAAVCRLLGIRHAVVAATRADLVDDELANLALSESLALVRENIDPDAQGVICSAVTRQGLEELHAAVLSRVRALPAPACSVPPRLSVDRAFSVKGVGTVVTGTLVSGSVAVGDKLNLVRPGRCTAVQIRGLQVHDAKTQRAQAATRVALQLAGAGSQAARKGDIITGRELAESTQADVLLHDASVLRPGMECLVYSGTARVRAKLVQLAPGPADTQALGRLRLIEAMSWAGGDRFIVRAPGATAGRADTIVAGGVVLDALPGRAPFMRRRQALGMLAAGQSETALLHLIRESAPRLLKRQGLLSRFNFTAEALDRTARVLEQRGWIRGLGDRGWVAIEALRAVCSEAKALVQEHQHGNPYSTGMPVQTLREKLARGSSPEVAAEAIRVVCQEHEGGLLLQDGVVCAGGRAQPGPIPPLLRTLIQLMQQAAGRGATEYTLAAAARCTGQELRTALSRLAREGQAVHAGDLWFHNTVVRQLESVLRVHLGAAGSMTVIDFKRVTGLPRKQAVLLLEHFDSRGVTRRQGDARVLFS